MDCPAKHCERTDAHIRKMAKGRRQGALYVQCPDCGPVMLRGQKFQEWCLDRAKFVDTRPAPEPPKPAPDPEPPTPPPAPVPEKKPFSLW